MVPWRSLTNLVADRSCSPLQLDPIASERDKRDGWIRRDQVRAIPKGIHKASFTRVEASFIGRQWHPRRPSQLRHHHRSNLRCDARLALRMRSPTSPSDRCYSGFNFKSFRLERISINLALQVSVYIFLV